MRPALPRVVRSRSAFTLLELMTVIVVLSILMVILAPVLSAFRQRAQKVKCIANLRSLHVASSSYVQDNQHWPQIPAAKHGDTAAAQAWINIFQPYGLMQINWICPSIQEALRSPDLGDPLNARVDYFGTPFNAKPTAPFQQTRQAWYIEAADIHGNGQEIIFPDGHIEEAQDILRAVAKPAGGSRPPIPGIDFPFSTGPAGRRQANRA